MKLFYKICCFFILIGFTVPCFASESEEPSVYFMSPKNGEVVNTTFHINMAVHGLSVAPAGKVQEGSGHHHLVIDGASVPKGETVPNDETHKHFGKGQTETTLTLTPGEHTLTLQFADGMHTSYGSTLSQTIKITVK